MFSADAGRTKDRDQSNKGQTGMYHRRNFTGLTLTFFNFRELILHVQRYVEYVSSTPVEGVECLR